MTVLLLTKSAATADVVTELRSKFPKSRDDPSRDFLGINLEINLENGITLVQKATNTDLHVTAGVHFRHNGCQGELHRTFGALGLIEDILVVVARQSDILLRSTWCMSDLFES